MARHFSSRRPFLFIPPWAAICSSLILGAAYFSVELYEYHHSYHDKEGIWQVCFTPGQHCQKRILKLLREAKKSIAIQAYGFTDPDIMGALIQAKKRGIKVEVILDHSNLTAKNSGLKSIHRHHISIRIDHLQGIAHNKIMIIDDHILVTGSYNFSNSAYLRNAENVLIVHDKTLVKEYLENWQKRWEASKPYLAKKRSIDSHL